MLTLPLFNTSLQYLCPTVDSRHRSACLVSALQECPHWRVFGDLLRLTHCIPAPAAVSAVSAPAVRRTPHCGHLRSGSCYHLARDGRRGGTSLIFTRTYQIFKLKSIFFFLHLACTFSFILRCKILSRWAQFGQVWGNLATFCLVDPIFTQQQIQHLILTLLISHILYIPCTFDPMMLSWARKCHIVSYSQQIFLHRIKFEFIWIKGNTSFLSRP